MKPSNPIVFMDLKIDDERVGRIIIELFVNIVPKTVENFLALCVGSHVSAKTGKKLHYKGTIFHKVLPRVFIQGGDVTSLDGSSGESIFGLSFENENHSLKHDRPGILSSVNSGESKNNSQFIITIEECPHLDGSCVVFGQVVKGFACVVEVSEVKAENDCPLSRCVIEECGELLLGEPWNYIEKDETTDAYPPDPRDVELNNFTVIKKERGNAKAYFRRGKALKYLNDYEGALMEQKKALSLAPNDKTIWDEIAKIKSMKKNYLAEEKKVFSRMFRPFK